MKTRSNLFPVFLRSGKSMISLIMCLLVAHSARLQAQVIQSFHAELRNDAVYFNWELMPNTSYQLLEVERSSDMVSYSTCLAVNHQNSKLSGWDKQPLAWISYYRLKVTGTNGMLFYSANVMIRNNQISKNNQTAGNLILQQDWLQETAARPVNLIVICDIHGNHSRVWRTEGPDMLKYDQIESQLPAGIPYMLLHYRNDQLIERVIKIKSE